MYLNNVMIHKRLSSSTSQIVETAVRANEPLPRSSRSWTQTLQHHGLCSSYSLNIMISSLPPVCLRKAARFVMGTWPASFELIVEGTANWMHPYCFGLTKTLLLVETHSVYCLLGCQMNLRCGPPSSWHRSLSQWPHSIRPEVKEASNQFKSCAIQIKFWMYAFESDEKFERMRGCYLKTSVVAFVTALRIR